MAGLLVAIAVMGVTLSMVMPTWSTWAKREKEAELIFRGEQYMRAIELYQRRFAGAYPTDVDALMCALYRNIYIGDRNVPIPELSTAHA